MTSPLSAKAGSTPDGATTSVRDAWVADQRHCDRSISGRPTCARSSVIAGYAHLRAREGVPCRTSIVQEAGGPPDSGELLHLQRAQAAVDKLSDERFAVQNVAIVGVDLRLVESVVGELSWARAALSGLGMGAWFGFALGLFVSFRAG